MSSFPIHSLNTPPSSGEIASTNSQSPKAFIFGLDGDKTALNNPLTAIQKLENELSNLSDEKSNKLKKATEPINAEYAPKFASISDKIETQFQKMRDDQKKVSEEKNKAEEAVKNEGLKNAANPAGDFKSLQDVFHDVRNTIGHRDYGDKDTQAKNSWKADFIDKAIPALQKFANKVDPDHNSPFNLTIGVNVAGKDNIRDYDGNLIGGGEDRHPKFYKEITLSLVIDKESGIITNDKDVSEQVLRKINDENDDLDNPFVPDTYGSLENAEMTLVNPADAKSIHNTGVDIFQNVISNKNGNLKKALEEFNKLPDNIADLKDFSSALQKDEPAKLNPNSGMSTKF